MLVEKEQILSAMKQHVFEDNYLNIAFGYPGKQTFNIFRDQIRNADTKSIRFIRVTVNGAELLDILQIIVKRYFSDLPTDDDWVEYEESSNPRVEKLIQDWSELEAETYTDDDDDDSTQNSAGPEIEPVSDDNDDDSLDGSWL